MRRTPIRANATQRDVDPSLSGEASGTQTLPIAPRPLPIQIASYLRELIIHDRLKPGERIREQSVANKLSVSRTPLREALTILVSEGLITNDPNRGCSVTLQDEATLYGAQMVEAKLESLAGAIICENRNARAVQGFRRQFGKIQKAVTKVDQETMFNEEQVLFGNLVQHSNNKTLINLHEHISLQTYRERYLRAIGYKVAKEKLENIDSIIDAIATGNSIEVRSLIFAYRSSLN